MKLKIGDRVVTRNGLGYIVHVFDKEGTQVSYKARGIAYAGDTDNIRLAEPKDFYLGVAEVYKRKDKLWDFRLISVNKNLVGTSGGQGYENKKDVIDLLNSTYIDFRIKIIKVK